MPLIIFPRLLFFMALRSDVSVPQYASALMVLSFFINSVHTTPSQSKKTVAMTIPADGATLNFFRAGEVCLHSIDALSVSGVK